MDTKIAQEERLIMLGVKATMKEDKKLLQALKGEVKK